MNVGARLFSPLHGSLPFCCWPRSANGFPVLFLCILISSLLSLDKHGFASLILWETEEQHLPISVRDPDWVLTTISSTDQPLIPRSVSPGTCSLHGRRAPWGLLASLFLKAGPLDSHILSYAGLSSTYTCLQTTLRWKAAQKGWNPTRYHSMLSFPILLCEVLLF